MVYVNTVNRPYRSRLEIIYQIVIHLTEPLNKTQLMYNSRMSTREYDDKLRYLIKMGCLEIYNESIDRDLIMLKLSDKGRILLDKIHSLNDLLPIEKLDFGIGIYRKQKQKY